MKNNTNDQKTVSRRNFLRGALAAVAVVGFDAHLGSWATAADLASGRARPVDGFPHFDGQLLTDDAALSAAADDFGHAIHRRPMAVLKPGSVEDVVRLIDFTRRHGIEVAARGQGHSTLGQAQVAAGVVIDMSTLAAMHEITAGDALVDAGVLWSDLTAADPPPRAGAGGPQRLHRPFDRRHPLRGRRRVAVLPPGRAGGQRAGADGGHRPRRAA